MAISCVVLGSLSSPSSLWRVGRSGHQVASVKSAASLCSMERRQVVSIIEVTLFLLTEVRLCRPDNGLAQRNPSLLSIDASKLGWPLPPPSICLRWSIRHTSPYGCIGLYQSRLRLRLPRCILYPSHPSVLVQAGAHLGPTLHHHPRDHRPCHSNLHARRLRIPLVHKRFYCRSKPPDPQDIRRLTDAPRERHEDGGYHV